MKIMCEFYVYVCECALCGYLRHIIQQLQQYNRTSIISNYNTTTTSAATTTSSSDNNNSNNNKEINDSININNDKWGRRVAGGIWENYDPKLDQSFTSTGRICKLHREGLYTVITTESL